MIYAVSLSSLCVSSSSSMGFLVLSSFWFIVIVLLLDFKLFFGFLIPDCVPLEFFPK